MDIAYDHIQGESFSPTGEDASTNNNNNNTQQAASASDSNSATPTPTTSSAHAPPPSDSTPQSQQQEQQGNPQSLNAEFTQAFKAVSSSPWGSAIGGWWSSARKQGETIYQDLQKEASEAQREASKGFTQASKGFESLREQVANRTRGLSLRAAEPGPLSSVPGEEAVPGLRKGESGVAGAGVGVDADTVDEESVKGKGKGKEKELIDNTTTQDPTTEERPESLPADIVKEAGTLVASLRTTAASRLKDLQRAEDAADEALLKFGLNVRNFLRDAVTISAPDGGAGGAGGNKSEVLFETQEPGTGKKVFHSNRLDAQLHAIHTTPGSFTQDPVAGNNEAWSVWEKEFDAETMTEAIARDLERFEELRRAMEKLVPEKVEYRVFWMRYYFLRKAIEEEEKRRKEVLRGAASNPQEEVSWDDDDDDDTNNEQSSASVAAVTTNKAASESTTTLSAATPAAANSSLKPTASPRRSHEEESKSVADSDASYDIVSGATSRAPGSPKEEKRTAKDEESEDDWE